MSGRDDGCRIKERPKGTGVEGEGSMSYKERYRSTVVEDERIIIHRSHRLLKTMTMAATQLGESGLFGLTASL